jgi:hypothetical protein
MVPQRLEADLLNLLYSQILKHEESRGPR